MIVPRDLPLGQGSTEISLGNRVAVAILVTLRAAWDRTLKRSDIHVGCGEVEMTERLRESMRQVLQAREHPWERTMVVLPGTESKSRPEMSRPDGLTDIPILLTDIFQEQGVHDPHAIIECKRLSETDASLSRLYVVEGIDRFKSRKYGRDHRVGFMVGYLLMGTAKGVVSQVNRYLQRKDRNTEWLKPSELIRECWAWQSSHPRPQARTKVQIHHAHLFLGKSQDDAVDG